MDFGQQLRHLRSQHGLSLRALGRLANCSGQHVSTLENGRSRPSPQMAAALDGALHAGGALIAAAHAGGDEVQRRVVLQHLGLVGIGIPLVANEAVRAGLAAALADERHGDEWAEAATEYGHGFYATAPATLLRDLTDDLAALNQRILATAPGRRAELYRAAGQMGAVCAMAWSSVGDNRQARWWWRVARQAADGSGDTQTQVWVRGWEVANGLYEQRPATVILQRASEAAPLARRACAGSAGLFAGTAQTLAVAGRRQEALAALRKVADVTERLPPQVCADDSSMFGWPEVRLRHTESFVFTALGETALAYEAQDRALELYPPDLARERAAMLLHRATCMIRDGDVGGGIGHATATLDGLPAEHRTELVHAIGRQTLAAVPAPERRRPDAAAFAERLANAA